MIEQIASPPIERVGRLSHQVNAVLIIALRDVLKFVRDRPRLLSTFIFPFIFILVLGGTFDASLGQAMGYSYITFVFTGVLAQTTFESTVIGMIYLLEDRENDFSQEMFVSPISRYAIIGGKIAGEAGVAFLQGFVILIFGWLIGVSLTWMQVLLILPVLLISSLFGGGLGLLMLSNFSSRRAATQIFPFFILPQYFLAGVFTPLIGVSEYLRWASYIAPMRYPVDLLRGIFYAGLPEREQVVILEPLANLGLIAVFFVIFLVAGTIIFVRKETNR